MIHNPKDTFRPIRGPTCFENGSSPVMASVEQHTRFDALVRIANRSSRSGSSNGHAKVDHDGCRRLQLERLFPPPFVLVTPWQSIHIHSVPTSDAESHMNTTMGAW